MQDSMIDKLVNEQEGGFRLVVVTDDRGGRTYAGITEQLYLEWMKENGYGVEAMPDELPKETVYAIYTDKFAKPLCIDELAPVLQEMVFSCAVNCGVRLAGKLLQHSANMPDDVCDGIVGPQTIEAIDAYLKAFKYGQLNNNFVRLWLDHYTGIVQHDASQAKFLGGWHNRAMKFFIPG